MSIRLAASVGRCIRSIRTFATCTSANMPGYEKGVASKWPFTNKLKLAKQFMESDGFALPAEISIAKNKLAVVQLYREEDHFEDVCRILQTGSEENSKGVVTDEFPSEEDVRRKIKSSKVVVTIDKDTGVLVAAWLFFRSPLARSTRPVHSGGFVLVNSEYRGKGVAELLLVFMAFMTIDSGLTGLYGRVGITAKTIVPARRAGSYYSGIIPNSLKVQGQDEWLDDIICACDLSSFPNYQALLQKWLIEKSQTKIPEMQLSDEKKTELDNSARLWDEKLVVKNWDDSYCVETPNAQQFIQLERMLRAEAEEGTGFAIDEFTDEGLFNRQLIRNGQDIVVTEKPGGNLIAGAIFGQSAICRTLSPMAGAYFLVKKEYRRQGIAEALLNFVIEELERQNYKGLLVDIFPHCGVFLSILLSNGFSITGSMPKAAYVKGQGLIDSIVLYKDFTVPPDEKLPPAMFESKM